MTENEFVSKMIPLALNAEQRFGYLACVLVAPAVDQGNIIALTRHHANLGRTLDVEAATGGLHQFVHGNAFLCLVWQGGTSVNGEEFRKGLQTSDRA